jgi:type II secretory pathway pseudopilin PulG
MIGSPRRAAFTLVELLVVIGIIVLLIGILLPVVSAVRRSAEKNATRLDLQTIGLALESYRKDFGDYPRPPDSQRKYRLLAWALIGPYDANQGTLKDPLAPTGSPTPNFADGADGPGFRTLWDSGTQKGSKVWGPYLPPDKFKLINKATDNVPNNYLDLKWDIADRFGTPIEYFPRWRGGPPDPTKTCLFGGLGTSTGKQAIYDYRQQWIYDPTTSPAADSQLMRYLRVALGDQYPNKNPATPPNDLIDAGETANEMPAFILVSAGISRVYPDDKAITSNFQKCDTITNLQH